MAKPWNDHKRPDKSEGPGDRADEAKEEGEGKEIGGEGGEGFGEGNTQNSHPHPRRSASRHREGHLAREREEEPAEYPEESEEDGGRDRDAPMGAPVKVTHVGGAPSPQRKTRTSRDSTQNVRTCCCRELWRLTEPQ